MARQDATSLYQVDDNTKLKLMEKYGAVIEAVKAGALSLSLKAQAYSGDPKAGSVEYRRLQTAASKTYGTARSNAAGDKIKADPITVNLNTHREIVEEFKKMEVERLGVDNLVGRRQQAHVLSMITELDTAFFAQAVSAGSEVDVSGEAAVKDKVEALIRDVESTENEYIPKGIDRSFLVLALSPAYYDALEDYINTLPNPANGGVKMDVFKRVRVVPNLNQTKDAIVMATESIAQPVSIMPYETDDIPLSADQAVQMFYDYGTKALMPDLVKYATLGDVASA